MEGRGKLGNNYFDTVVSYHFLLHGLVSNMYDCKPYVETYLDYKKLLYEIKSKSNIGGLQSNKL